MRGSEPSPAPRSVAVRSLADAVAAAEAARTDGVALDLVSAEDIARGLGVGWFIELRALIKERFPGLPVTLTIDCGDAAGVALGALRRGAERVIYRGDDVARARLAAIARQSGAAILDVAPAQDALTASSGPL